MNFIENSSRRGFLQKAVRVVGGAGGMVLAGVALDACGTKQANTKNSGAAPRVGVVDDANANVNPQIDGAVIPHVDSASSTNTSISTSSIASVSEFTTTQIQAPTPLPMSTFVPVRDVSTDTPKPTAEPTKEAPTKVPATATAKPEAPTPKPENPLPPYGVLKGNLMNKKDGSKAGEIVFSELPSQDKAQPDKILTYAAIAEGRAGSFYIFLSQPVIDGEQIQIGTVKHGVAKDGTQFTSGIMADGKFDIKNNTMSGIFQNDDQSYSFQTKIIGMGRAALIDALIGEKTYLGASDNKSTMTQVVLDNLRQNNIVLP